MDFKINTTNKKFNFDVTVKTKALEHIKCTIFDTDKKHIVYADRESHVEVKKVFSFSFPFTPSESLTVSVYNLKNGNLEISKDKSFGATFKVKPFVPKEVNVSNTIRQVETINKIHKLQSKY